MALIICNRAIPFLEVLVFSCFLSKFSIAIDKITTTKPITNTDSIISSNNAFQLGFFSPINTTNRYVGIWYSNIPVRTVVWAANRERPLTDSSGTMIVSNDGNLLILNGQKQIIWSSNVSNPVANSSAQLLDSGNLVIKDDSNGRKIWESFHYLSDSALPEMKLGSDASVNVKTMLRSWNSSSDPSVGTFSSSINSLTIPEFYTWNGSHPYWRSGPWNGQIYIGMPHPTHLNGYTLVSDNRGNAYATFSTFEAVHFHFVLNPNGTIIAKYMNELKQWAVVWFSPETDCDVYGKCGPFGNCNSGNSPICTCLMGFEPNNVEEWNRKNFSSGCVRKTSLKCKTIGSSNPENEDRFLKLNTTKVPALPNLASVKENQCQNLCLINCSCTAYAYQQGIGCMWWSGSLIDIQKFSSGGADLFIRVANSEPDKQRNMKFVIVVSVIIGSIIMAICTYFVWMWMAKQKVIKKNKCNMNQVKLEELPLFKFEKLAIATDNFDETNKLGQGGFGLVYKGKLDDGQEIAVKRLSRSFEQGIEEFMNEVVVISKLQHRTLLDSLAAV